MWGSGDKVTFLLPCVHSSRTPCWHGFPGAWDEEYGTEQFFWNSLTGWYSGWETPPVYLCAHCP